MYFYARIFSIAMSKKQNWIFSEAYLHKQQITKELSDYSTSQLIDLIIELRNEVNNLNVKKSETKHIEPATDLSGYKQEWSYPRKLAFLLIQLNKPLTSVEIQGYFTKMDKGFKRLQRPISTLSGILHRACTSGRIAKYKLKGQRELLFVMPMWLDKDGELKEAYQKYIKYY